MTFEPPRRRRRPLALVAGALVAAAAVLGTVLVVGSGGTAAPQAAPTTPANVTPAAAAPGPLAVEHTADPCSLFEPAVLNRIGSARIEPDRAEFHECTADITITGGHVVTLWSELFNGPETQRASSGWGPPNAPVVLEESAGDGICDRRVLVPDGSSVVLSAVGPVPVDRLCAIVGALTESAAARLVNPGVAQKLWPAESVLAAHNACDLLTPDEVAPATGSSTRSWPGWAGFSCQWGLPDAITSNVTILFDRTSPFDADDGEAGDFGGHPGRMVHTPGEDCTVNVQMREYVDNGGYPRIEVLRVSVFGTEATTCAIASGLATTAVSRLVSP